jgi:hypothetical protein
MSSRREIVINTLRHSNKGSLPRGELFFSRKFLDFYFSDFQGDYVGQVAAAARLLGLSAVGVDLNEEWSGALLREGSYERLNEYFTVGYINGPVLRATAQLGFRRAMVCIKKDQQTFVQAVSIQLKDVEEKCRLAKENDLSAVLLADDIAGNRGLLFSYSDFTSVILPLYRQIASTIKSNGLYAFFHSDGATKTIIEPLIEAGYYCIHPIDNQAGLNLYELKNTFESKVSFMGHIDIITWNKERIGQEVNNAENVFKKGGLIVGSTCGLSMKTVTNKLSALYPHWQRGGQGA